MKGAQITRQSLNCSPDAEGLLLMCVQPRRRAAKGHESIGCPSRRIRLGPKLGLNDGAVHASVLLDPVSQLWERQMTALRLSEQCWWV